MADRIMNGFFSAFYNLNFTNYPCPTKIKVEKKGNTPPKSGNSDSYSLRIKKNF